MGPVPMNRRFALRALLAALVLGSLAAIPVASKTPPARLAAPPAADLIASYAVPAGAQPSALCPPRLVTLQFSFGTGCIHQGGDPRPAAGPSSSASKAAREGPVATPKCYGNGENGSRIQLIYAYLFGTPNRSSKIVPQILKTFVPHMEGIFRKTSKDEGRELGLRFYAPGCLLGVDVVGVPYNLVAPKVAGAKQFPNLVQYLYDNGYQDSNKKYLVWLDAAAGFPACGVGMLAGDESPTPINVMDGNPAFGLVPASVLGVPPMFATVFGPGCWGSGSPLAHSELHELLHTLGAVQFSTPNSNQAGHCVDAYDIMCYSDPNAPPELRVMQPRCVKQPTTALDCNADDYFNASPPPDSYVATHLNIADSQFLGAAPLDVAPVRFPRF